MLLSTYSAYKSPSESFNDNSTLSEILFSSSFLLINLSINNSILCLIFLLRFGTLSISYILPSILIFSKPCFLKFKISLRYSPFLPLTIGENKFTLDGFGKSNILSTISLIV